MLQQEAPDDYVVSRARTTASRSAEVAFSHVGLDWRTYVRKIRNSCVRPKSTTSSAPAKARAKLGWRRP